MHAAKCAEVLKMTMGTDSGGITFPYEIDNAFSGELKIELPFELDPSDNCVLPSLALAASVFLAQLCLARTIVSEFPCNEEMVGAIRPIVQLLYDVRCFKDRIPYQPTPHFNLRWHSNPKLFTLPSVRRASLLWSGGIDSTLCLISLLRNEYELFPLHIASNKGSEISEEQAVRELSHVLGVPYSRGRVFFPQLSEIGRHYSTAFDVFPYENAVPFGRDLLLILVAALIARRQSTPFVCIGGDYDGRHRQIRHNDRTIHRHDLESAYACSTLQSFLWEFVSPSLRLMPPLAQLTKYRILHEMIVKHPVLASTASFCFWGEPCGRCFKCQLYYLAERALQRKVFAFQTDPVLDRESEIALCVSDPDSENIPSSQTFHYFLSRIVERGEILPQEALLLEYRDRVYPQFQGRLTEMEQSLMHIYPDSIIPNDFHVL